MITTPRFQQNPAGLNQVLTILPGHISVNFNPKPVWQRASDPDLGETVLILAGHGFILRGDFRLHYEHAATCGGHEACVRLYLDMKPNFDGQWSSPEDPMRMLAIAEDNARRDNHSATTWNHRPVLREVALAM